MDAPIAASSTPVSLAGDAGMRTFGPQESLELLRECLHVFAAAMRKAARLSSDTATDLFEHKHIVDDKDELDFLVKREEWVHRFGEALTEFVERRFTGAKRRGRRPDTDVSVATLRVLNPFDQEKQAALAQARRNLHRWSRKELDALDMRVAVLLGEPVVRDVDNPFGPDYLVDAVGASARAMFPNPRVWRPFMERVLADITPAVPKAYISLNRLLADRGVLPDIKAALRARSELRPADDKDLLPLFSRLLEEAGPNVESIDIEVPAILDGMAPEPMPPVAQGGVASESASTDTPASASSHAAPASSAPPADGPLLNVPLPGDAAADIAPAPAAAAPNSPQAQAAVQAAATAWPASAPAQTPRRRATDVPNAFPTLDPMLTLGSSSPVFEVLAQWQNFDPQDEITRRALEERGVNTSALPLNRIPYIRVAMGTEPVSATDKITMDVISLLFDYIFRDPSIPESARGIFGRLQVPILKAALLERTFFSDKKHPARRVLDRLASAAVGSSNDKAYRIAFEGVASRVVDDICRDLVLDVEVFEKAARELAAFMDAEQRNVVRELGNDIEAALDAEERDADHAQARALIRDRLAGLRLPLDVRMFAETAWADYLTVLHQQHGEQSSAYRDALQTMDDLLWSITAKERTAQKARLTKMVPGIIGNLRKGCNAVQLPDDRATPFFDTLYQLHMAAIKPRVLRPVPAETEIAPTIAPAPTVDKPTPAAVTRSDASDTPTESATVAAVTAAEEAAVQTGGFSGTNNYHDYVSEMAVGTWLAFRTDKDWMNARLTWVSPLRTKYIFTSRARTSAFVYSPEELAWELGAGRARIVLEPVPLFDRAVSAALDSIAARKGAAAH